MMTKPKRILIADDEAADVGLIQIVLEEQGLQDDAAVANTGEDVFDYLYRRGKYSNMPEGVPELVLLDLKLPKISGLEILRKMRSDKRFRDVSVVIFSSSLDEKDREKSFTFGATDFKTKPTDFDAFRNTIRTVTEAYLSKGAPEKQSA
ncbi:MAG: response regulator [Desulfobulbaceae bacterium]|nr:response regulator [Desulfobulbaceae bacterium]